MKPWFARMNVTQRGVFIDALFAEGKSLREVADAAGYTIEERADAKFPLTAPPTNRTLSP